jgi:hypothetical protein
MMARIKWREVFKFLSGRRVRRVSGELLLVSLSRSCPISRLHHPPELLGARAAFQFVLFVVFFYFGYLKK